MWQQAILFDYLIAADKARREISVGIPDQLFVNLDLLRGRDRMFLSIKVGLKGTFLVAARPDVFGLDYVALVVDDEPFVVCSSGRPQDLCLAAI